MKKDYFIIDSESGRICYRKSVAAFWDYTEAPKMRKGGIMVRIGIDCVLGGLGIGFINSKFSFLQLPLLEGIAWTLMCLALALFIFGAVYGKLASKDEKTTKCRRTIAGKARPDPYHLVDEYPDGHPTKKTYYIVDSETNTIVDVKHLGKWGQAYLAWRGRRQRNDA